MTGEIKLLIVDPIVSAVAGDSHKNAEVRRGLQPLVDAGQKMGAAVLGAVADVTSIDYVFKLCAFLPAIGLLTVFLPNFKVHKI